MLFGGSALWSKMADLVAEVGDYDERNDTIFDAPSYRAPFGSGYTRRICIDASLVLFFSEQSLYGVAL